MESTAMRKSKGFKWIGKPIVDGSSPENCRGQKPL